MKWGVVVLACPVVLVVLVVMVMGGGGSVPPPVCEKSSSSSESGSAPGKLGTLDEGDVPDQWVGLVRKAGKRCRAFPAPVIAAQIDQESGWDAQASSHAGAMGLAQFMPDTWDTWGEGSPENPKQALKAQAKYDCALASQVQSAKKDGTVSGKTTKLALAAYNAGFGAVEQAGGVPGNAETQGYVPKIMKLAGGKYSTGGSSSSGDDSDDSGDSSGQDGGQVQKAACVGKQGDSSGSSDGDWVAPVSGQCSSGFGDRGGDRHDGVDIAGPTGSVVKAAAAGTVQEAGPASGYGRWVKIRHPGGVVTIYGHIDRASTQAGKRVEAGDRIARRGNRGQSTGPHLHYQVEKDGDPVDPKKWNRSHGAPLCQ